ncbi:hypothetical protein [Anaerotignum sp.]
MWYVLADMYDGNRYVELFYGEELKDVAAKLEKYCDAMMQFDLEEMTMDEIDAYYTEGYDEYEKMIEEPSVETISALHFGCNGGKLDVRTVTDSYEEMTTTFEIYKKGLQKNWKLVPVITETAAVLKELEREWKALLEGTADAEKLQYFVK